MKFIITTNAHNGKKIYINPDQICAMYRSHNYPDHTIIQFPGEQENDLELLESPEAIANMSEKVTP